MSSTEGERTLHIEYDGRRVELAKLDDLDLGEMAMMKKLTGMSVPEQAVGLQAGDADCWTGLVLASLRRDDPSITLEQVQSINLWEQINKWEAEGEGDPGVPLEPADSPELSSMPSAPVVEGLANGNDQRISGRRPLERSYT